MFSYFRGIGETIGAHPWLTLALFVLTSLVVLRVFSEQSIGEFLSGALRLLRSIFVAPFHFIRTAVRAISSHVVDEDADARTRTYLLHRSIQYSQLGTLAVAILIIATGLVVALLGIWPSDQLTFRRETKASLETVNAQYAADSTRLAELTTASQATVEAQRSAQRDSLRRQRDQIATGVQGWWQTEQPKLQLPDGWGTAIDSTIRAKVASTASMGDTIAYTDLLVYRLQNAEPGESVWDDSPWNARFTEDSTLAAVAGPIRSALEALTKTDSAYRPLTRGLVLALSATQTQHSLVKILRLGSTEDEIASVKSSLEMNQMERDNLNQMLKAIDWFSGVKFFFVTILYTFLAFVAFVWAAGLAIETTLLFVGIAQDIAALRKRSE
jgi:hypothetical protein